MSRRQPTSLVIPTRGRTRLLLETVESVLRGTQIPDEILIVDQGTPDQTRLAIPGRGGCEIRVVPAPPRGLSAGRNVGIEAARHDVLAFSDDDMLAEPRWFEELIGALAASGPKTVVTGRVIEGLPEVAGGFSPATAPSTKAANYAGRIGTDVLAGGNMAAFRTMFDAVGVFDERLGAGAVYPAAEDNDFGLRVLEAGFEIRYVPTAVLTHRAWRRPWLYVPIRWRYGVGKGGFYAKHATFADPYMLRRLQHDVSKRMRRLPVTVMRHERRAIGDVLYVAGIGYGLCRWLLSERLRRARGR